MTNREEKQLEKRNDEFYALYRKLRDERMAKKGCGDGGGDMRLQGFADAGDC